MLFLLIIVFVLGLASIFMLPIVAVWCVVAFAFIKSFAIDMCKIFRQVFIEKKTSVEF